MSYFPDDDWDNHELVSGGRSEPSEIDLSSLQEGFYTEDELDLRDEDYGL